MRLEVDPSACQGHAQCHAAAPDLFTLDDEGYAVVAVDVLTADQLASARAAVAACPERAVALLDDGTRAQR